MPDSLDEILHELRRSVQRDPNSTVSTEWAIQSVNKIINQIVIEAKIEETHRTNKLLTMYNLNNEGFWGEGYEAVQRLIANRREVLEALLSKEGIEVSEGAMPDVKGSK